MNKVPRVILFDPLESYFNPTCDVDIGKFDEHEVCKPAPASCASPYLPCKNIIQCMCTKCGLDREAERSKWLDYFEYVAK